MTPMALALLLLLSAGVQDAKDVDILLERLEAEDIDVREAAARDLVSRGPGILPLLRSRAAGLAGEARGRLEDAVRRIERNRKRDGVLPPLRTVTLEAKERPAKEVLEEIAAQAGLKLEFGGVPPEAPLTLSLKDASPFQAFEEACRKAGDLSFEPVHVREGGVEEDFMPENVRGELSKSSRLVIQNGAAPAYPAAVVRHYRLRATQVSVTRTVDFRQNRSSAHVQLELQWLPGVAPLALSGFAVEAALDDQGRSLLPDKAEERVGFGQRHYRGGLGRGSGGYPYTLALPVPPADAKAVAVLRGTAIFSFPGDLQTLVFEKAPEAAGRSLELDGLKILLKEIRAAEGLLTLTLHLSGRYAGARGAGSESNNGAPFAYDDLQVLTEAGKRLQTRGMSGSGDGTTTRWTLRYALPPGETVKEIRIPCILERFEDEVKFELRDIPLPR